MASLSFPQWACSVCGNRAVASVTIRLWDTRQTLHGLTCEVHRDEVVRHAELQGDTAIFDELVDDTLPF